MTYKSAEIHEVIAEETYLSLEDRANAGEFDRIIEDRAEAAELNGITEVPANSEVPEQSNESPGDSGSDVLDSVGFDNVSETEDGFSLPDDSGSDVLDSVGFENETQDGDFLSPSESSDYSPSVDSAESATDAPESSPDADGDN